MGVVFDDLFGVVGIRGGGEAGSSSSSSSMPSTAMWDWTWLRIMSMSVGVLIVLVVVACVVMWLIGIIRLPSFINNNLRLLITNVVSSSSSSPTSSFASTSCAINHKSGSWVLLMTRVCSSLYLLFVIIWGLLDNEFLHQKARWMPVTHHQSWTFFIFLTNWSLIYNWLYFTVSVALSIHDMFIIKDKPWLQSPHDASPLRKRIEVWHMVAFETVGSFEPMVSVLFWGVLVAFGCAPKHTCRYTFGNCNAHGTVVLIVFVEMILCSRRWILRHGLITVLYLALWEVVQTFAFFGTGQYTYPDVQDPANAHIFAYLFYPLFFVLYACFFIVMWSLNRLIALFWYKSNHKTTRITINSSEITPLVANA